MYEYFRYFGHAYDHVIITGFFVASYENIYSLLGHSIVSYNNDLTVFPPKFLEMDQWNKIFINIFVQLQLFTGI